MSVENQQANSQRIVVGPFNRVEGDLEISLDVVDGKVAAAFVNSPLFRGFEQVLVGRAPLDALAIVPRICGICSVAQSAAAVAALENAMGLAPTTNGALARNLVLAAENLADHLSHFYLFFMPDFTREAYAARPWYAPVSERFTAMRGSAANEVLPARAAFLRLMGFLAGKWPHTLALQPGGSTRGVSAAERIRLASLLREFRAFLEKVLFADSLAQVAALSSEADLRAWAAGNRGDFAAFVRIADDLQLGQVGRAADLYLSGGAYRDAAGAAHFIDGLWAPGDGSAVPFVPGAVLEDSTSAWLVDAGGPLSPAQGETQVEADKPGAYTWCKAPRYAGAVVEVGALARQLIDGQPLLRDLVTRQGGSVLARVTARLLEIARVLPVMEQWLAAIEPGAAFCAQGVIPDEGRGVGIVEAARGTLGHWLEIHNGSIARYQIVAPTTWNFSPRDSMGTPGALEQALVGLAVGERAPPTIQHVVRSFDPCMVCTVH